METGIECACDDARWLAKEIRRLQDKVERLARENRRLKARVKELVEAGKLYTPGFGPADGEQYEP